ncbi:hypothetical protein C8J57DRAFT_682253 [Mycena rebaudengoi]|nr:hypothetical protein C8J57DRAFT_682253 [Mycena rebaudengoi]
MRHVSAAGAALGLDSDVDMPPPSPRESAHPAPAPDTAAPGKKQEECRLSGFRTMYIALRLMSMRLPFQRTQPPPRVRRAPAPPPPGGPRHDIQRIVSPPHVLPVLQRTQHEPLDRPLGAHCHGPARRICRDHKPRVAQQHRLQKAQRLRPIYEPRENRAGLRVQ